MKKSDITRKALKASSQKENGGGKGKIYSIPNISNITTNSVQIIFDIPATRDENSPASNAYQFAIFPAFKLLPTSLSLYLKSANICRPSPAFPINKRLHALPASSPLPIFHVPCFPLPPLPLSIIHSPYVARLLNSIPTSVEDRRWPGWLAWSGRSVPWRGNANSVHAARWIIILSPVTAIRYGKISWKLIYFNALPRPGVRGCSYETRRAKVTRRRGDGEGEGRSVGFDEVWRGRWRRREGGEERIEGCEDGRKTVDGRGV